MQATLECGQPGPAYLLVLPPPDAERLLVHLLAALGSLVTAHQPACASSPSGAAQQPGVHIDGALLKRITDMCLVCLRTSAHIADAVAARRTVAELQTVPQVSALPFARPLSEAAAALLAKLQERANKVVTEPLFASIAHGLAAGGPAERTAALTALLVGLESRQRPHVSARTVPDVLSQLVHTLADSPLLCADQAMARRDSGTSSELAPACSEALLCLRCAESIVTQAAVFRKLGPAGVVLFTSAARVAIAAGSLASTSCTNDAAQSATLEAAVLVVMGTCNLASSVLRHRQDVVALAWPGVAPCCTAALIALIAWRQACPEQLDARCVLVLLLHPTQSLRACVALE